MDFVKSIVNKNPNLDLNLIKNSSNSTELTKESNPLCMIEGQIKTLMDLNLSPLSTTKEEINSRQNEISVIIKKIVFYMDEILTDKLKPNPELSNQKFPKYSETGDKLKAKDNSREIIKIHYWDYISKHFQIPSVKFINNICDNIQTKYEKGLTWICISILENSFLDSLHEIYKQKFDIKFYQKDSLIITKKETVLDLVERISKLINIYDTNQISTYKEYLKYKKLRENQKFEDYSVNDNGVELPPNTLRKFASSKSLENSTGRNSDVSPINKLNSNAIDNFIHTPLNLNVLQSKVSYDSAQNNQKNLRTLDNIINLINKDNTTLIETNPNNIEDHHDNMSCIDHDEIEDLLPNEQNVPRRILKVNDMANVQVHLHKLKEKKGKILMDEDKTEHLIKNYNISKLADIREGFTENYFSFSLQHEKAINRINQYPVLVKAKSKNKITFPFEKFFVMISKIDSKKFTKKDIILVNNHKIRVTNSILLFLNHYYNKVEWFKFNTEIIHIKRPITIDMQNYQCYLCFKLFKLFLGIPLAKIYWCSYFSRWVCDDCISEEHSIIPAFILKDWSFKKFPISKNAKEILTKWYQKPVIYIKNRDKIFKISTYVRVASIYKRKIHKMFDLMKCEKAEKVIFEILGDHNYLVLKEILFSLKDLCEINEGSLILKMRDWVERIQHHITKECKNCNYKGGKCMMCLSDEILMAYDIENVLYCYDCKKIFHRKCSAVHPCIINRQ